LAKAFIYNYQNDSQELEIVWRIDSVMKDVLTNARESLPCSIKCWYVLIGLWLHSSLRFRVTKKLSMSNNEFVY